MLGASQRLVMDYRQQQWDIEHVFLALLRQEQGLTADIFRPLGLDMELVNRRLETALGNSERSGRERSDERSRPLC